MRPQLAGGVWNFTWGPVLNAISLVIGGWEARAVIPEWTTRINQESTREYWELSEYEG
jgi:hypothetical protein